MTTMTEVEHSLSLLTLPVELLYRLCDYLDTPTILLTFRNVCVRFYTIANNYKRYKLHFISMSKADFHRICRIIRPENILSLHLWYTNEQIVNSTQLFLSLFNIHQLTRLHSLSIWKADESNLNGIFRHIIAIAQITSLSIYSPLSNSNIETLSLLSQIIAQSTLRHLVLKFDLSDKDELLWPVQCAVEKLDIGGCTSEQFSSIFRHSPRLHTLALHDCKMHLIDESLISTPFQQLTHLTFYQTTMSIGKLEFILSLTPSLTHLYLRSFRARPKFLYRLSRWENFIRDKLSLLQKFKFYVTCDSFDVDNIETLIDGFRTPFWLKEKRWTINCEFRHLSRWSELTIYSSSKRQTYFPHQYDFNAIFCSTSTATNNRKVKIDSQWRVVLNVMMIMSPQVPAEYESLISLFLCKVNVLVLEIAERRSFNSLEFLSTLNNVKFPFDIWLIFDSVDLIDSREIQSLLRRPWTVHSLGICSKDDSITTTICDTFYNLNFRDKQLTIKTADVDCMKCILRRVERALSVQFVYDFPLPTVWTEINEWLTRRKEKFSSQQGQCSLTIQFHSRRRMI